MATERGSARMLRERPITKADLESIVELDGKEGIKLVGWLHRGTPVTDFVQGSFNAPIGQAGLVVTKLLSSEVLAHIKVHPIGVPVFDSALIEFGTDRG